MSGINKMVVFGVNRLRCTFENDLGGNPGVRFGTGFWIRTTPETRSFVSNRHLFDPLMAFKDDDPEAWTLKKVEILIRGQRDGHPTSETAWIPIPGLDCLRLSSEADVAILLQPSMLVKPYRIFSAFQMEDLATNDWFATNVQMGDAATFIGYPGASGTPWWDTKLQLGIARQASMASWPAEPFTNPLLKTADTLLVSGFSFSGSSGSPVITHQKGTGGSGIQLADYRPPKLVGIMSGHTLEKEPTGMFHHTGLSYFTRSTSILELLDTP